MPIFRGYCLDQDGHIMAGEDIEAIDLNEAIQKTRRLCGNWANKSIDHIEVWHYQTLLFATH